MAAVSLGLSQKSLTGNMVYVAMLGQIQRRCGAHQPAAAGHIGRIPSPMPDMIHAAPADEVASVPIDLAEFDLRRPVVQARLAERIPGGGYVVPDTALVRAIRVCDQRGELAQRDQLFTRLVERCRPMFYRYAGGLRHRPELRDDAIADMIAQLWKETLDPKERFIEQNFAYYLKCLCVDNFKRILRAEGYGYRVNEQGQITGRPEHVPTAMIDRIDRPSRTGDGDAVADVIPDTTDHLEKRLAVMEVERLLQHLTDPLDQRIVKLRVFGQLKWDEIAQVCKMSERTMRTRFEDARAYMAAVVTAGDAATDLPPAPVHQRGGPTRGRKKGTGHGN